MNKRLTLVSHHLCPYVQRAAISLREKRLAFERVYVDLDAPPSWFRALSPLGKVPLLRVGDSVVFESAVILEYLEDTAAPPLHPADPLERARHRAWIEYGSTILNDIWHFYVAPDKQSFEEARETLRTRFVRVEQELAAGPWFAGHSFSLVDCVYGPVFRYFDVFDRIADFEILSGLARLNAWRASLAQRPSVRDAVVADYPERLKAFLEARHSHLSSLLPAEANAA
jgi:glutathione S-transferase